MKSILIGLTLIFLIQWSPGYTQSNTGDTAYCLSLTKARLLVADALRLRLADSVSNLQAERIDLLETEKKAIYDTYTNLLNLSEQKFQKQKEITAAMERLANGWREEAEYYQRRYRKQRNQKGLLTAGVVVLIGLLVVK